MLSSDVDLDVKLGSIGQLSDVEYASEEGQESRLPYVEDAGNAWTKLYVFGRCSDPRPSECKAALQQGEKWWERVHQDVQGIFIEDEAPDEDSIREWTIERRRFFERWLATPTPVLTMEIGVFRLAPFIGAVFEDWARCAGDEDAVLRWKERAAE